MLSLLGVLVVVLGFVLRLNALVVVAVAALVTGLAAGLDLLAVIAALGKAFHDARYVSAIWLVLPVIGLLERFGLQERAKLLIGGIRGATVARLLLVYFVLRQVSAALGLNSIGGQAQTVRPLIAPMAEAAAEREHPLSPSDRERVRALAAATDNVALFFGEDIFMAIASILLIKGFLEANGIIVSPLDLSLWAIPTAVVALLVHGGRLLRFRPGARP